MAQIIALAGIVATGYFTYKVLIRKFQQPQDELRDGIVTHSFFSNDGKNLDLYKDINPNSVQKVHIIHQGSMYEWEFQDNYRIVINQMGLDQLRRDFKHVELINK